MSKSSDKAIVPKIIFEPGPGMLDKEKK